MDWKEKYPHYKTRDFDSTIPAFDSHDDAFAWFKSKFGKDFQFTGTDIINGEKCYFYHLIGHRKDYEFYQEYLKRAGRVAYQITEQNEAISENGMFSYNSVEIWESGGVHVVY
jgi:hypothetical protein